MLAIRPTEPVPIFSFARGRWWYSFLPPALPSTVRYEAVSPHGSDRCGFNFGLRASDALTPNDSCA